MCLTNQFVLLFVSIRVVVNGDLSTDELSGAVEELRDAVDATLG